MHPRRVRRLVVLDGRRLAQEESHLIDAVQQAVLGKGVDRELDLLAVRQYKRLSLEIDSHPRLGVLLAQTDKLVVGLLVDPDRQKAILECIVREDVGEVGRDDRLETCSLQRPRRMLARAAAAEIVARDQDFRARRLGLVQREIRTRLSILIHTPVCKECIPQPCLISHLEIPCRDDLVGVDIGLRQCHALGGEGRNRVHYSISRASAILPVTAVATAVSGLARKVRPPLPCRPSKFRLLVLTAYWPGWSEPPFMAMHIEQPASRHSAPASRKISSRPSSSAWCLTRCDPGTTSMRIFDATLRPLMTRAAWRRSEIRELVQLPTKTTSTGLPSSGSPGCRPI